jgi:hypothetical protein
MGQPTPAQRMEHVIRTYIQACNDADAEAIAASFCPEAVHYSPSGLTWSGAATIASNFVKIIREQGYCWTVDRLLIDVDHCTATLEWTRLNRHDARIVHGVERFVFEPQTWCIQEIRFYPAASVQPDTARSE